MRKLRILAIMMATALTFGMVGCGDKDDDLDYEGIILKNGESIEIESFGNDATASYPLHFTITLEKGQIVATGLYSKLTEAALSVPGMSNRDCPTLAKVADVGEVKALSKIEEYPAESEFDGSKAATEKHGYVIMAKGDMNLNGYEHPDLHDPATMYVRMWLEEATDGGFKVRYEYPFVPVED